MDATLPPSVTTNPFPASSRPAASRPHWQARRWPRPAPSPAVYPNLVHTPRPHGLFLDLPAGLAVCSPRGCGVGGCGAVRPARGSGQGPARGWPTWLPAAAAAAGRLPSPGVPPLPPGLSDVHLNPPVSPGTDPLHDPMYSLLKLKANTFLSIPTAISPPTLSNGAQFRTGVLFHPFSIFFRSFLSFP